MNIQIHGQTSPALNETIEKRLDAALGQHSEWIEKVAVHLWDENGPKGGVDKRCRLEIELRGRSIVQIEQSGEDLYVAASEAAERAKQAVGRKVARLRDRHTATLKH